MAGYLSTRQAYADMGAMGDKKTSSSTQRYFILGSIFGLKDAKPKYEPVSLPNNVQKLPLLKAPTNIDPQVKEEARLLVVDDSALSNENTGVDGTKISLADFKQNSDQISVYVVKEGDSLSVIAEMFGVTTATIKSGNDLGEKPIYPGQTLVILPVPSFKYVAKKGDTLASIAKVSGSDVDTLADFNDIKPDQTLAVGTTIIIPDGEGVVGPHNTVAANPQKPAQKKTTIKVTVKNVASKGYYACPINSIRTQGLHDGNAVDYGAPIGTPFIAAAGGKVLVARLGNNGGYGNMIIIAHPNGTQTLYGHASSLLVSAGDTVVKGQVIGKIGNTGRSTGPHVHFEVRGTGNPC